LINVLDWMLPHVSRDWGYRQLKTRNDTRIFNHHAIRQDLEEVDKVRAGNRQMTIIVKPTRSLELMARVRAPVAPQFDHQKRWSKSDVATSNWTLAYAPRDAP
jgi:DNA-binding response OmpR family regulator